MQLYQRAIDDCETALKLNEDSLKAWLLLAKALYFLGRKKEFETAIEEAKNRNKEQLRFIDGKYCFNFGFVKI